MANPFVYALISVILISVISLLGVLTFSLKTKKLQRILIYLVGFSAGALLGDAFIHLLPEAIEESGFGLNISLYILAGIAISFLLEKIIHWRHCHHHQGSKHKHHKPFAMMNLFGDAMHNLIDGLIIGASYLVSIPLGIATTLAVVLHEIPQELGDFGVLLHGGFTKQKAVFFNFLVSLAALLGMLIAFLLNTVVPNLTTFLIPFSAGAFIYIAGADLIPELHKETKVEKSFMQFIWFVLGVAVMVGLLFLEFPF